LLKEKECELGINFVVNKENADEIYKAGKLMHDLGVNHIKYTARMTNDVNEYHEKFKESVINQIKRVKEEFQSERFSVINLYESDFELSAVFKRQYSNCVMKDIVTVIAADCKLYYCHDKAYLKNGIIGDIKDKSFQEIWFSRETDEKFNCFDASKECQHHCVYDDRNILLNTFLSLNKNHINFI
jgi:MoaA/NifB/PqqE/SkfB family radical SAM enzyme